MTLGGRIQAEQIGELQRLVEAKGQPLVLDLDEIELVDREVVRFLAHCQAAGARLEKCATHIRSWMEQESDEE